MNARRLVLLVVAAAGCNTTPELELAIRLPGDRSRLAAITRVNMTATRNGVVFASSSTAAGASTVSLHGLTHGADTVISLDGVDDSGTLIARGKTCPIDFQGGGMSTPLYFAPLNFFAPTVGTPSVARQSPSALALDDGTVLVMGGRDASGAVQASSDRFTPGSATFAASAPALDRARTRAQAVKLTAVGLLVVGGVDGSGNTIAEAELYSETQQAFLPISDPRLDGRVGHRVSALSDSSALVSGGSNSDSGAPLATTLLIEVRSDGTSRVTQSVPLVEARRDHAVIVASGVPVVFGGHGAGGTPLSSIEAIDQSGSASVIGHLQYARANATASLLSDGSILIVGGVGADGQPLDTAELYNPYKQSTSVATMATARTGHSATELTADRVLVAGGAIDRAGTPSALVELFVSGVFVNERSLGTPRAQHAAVSLCDDSVLFVGGGDGAELYSPPASF